MFEFLQDVRVRIVILALLFIFGALYAVAGITIVDLGIVGRP